MTESRNSPWGRPDASAPSTLTHTPPDAWAAAAPRRRPRRPWRRWVLLAVLAVAALAVGLVQCGTQRAAVETPPAPAAGVPAPGAAADPPGVAGAPDASAAAGTLTAGATSLYDAVRAGGLARLAGQTAIARGVPVQAVVADEGFWIGSGEADRLWVQLSSDDESPVTITPGQRLDMSGPVVSHGADFAGKAGVTAEEGAVQLTREGAHLEVDPTTITVVGP